MKSSDPRNSFLGSFTLEGYSFRLRCCFGSIPKWATSFGLLLNSSLTSTRKVVNCFPPRLHSYNRLRCSCKAVIISEDSSNGTGKINQPDQVRPDWLQDYFSRPRPSAPLPLWSPPEDPDKPSLPYIHGLVLSIDRHAPPPPFVESLREGLSPRPSLSEDYLRRVPQSKAVVDNPPIETDPPARLETARLVVTAPICIGAARGAQIIGCTIYPQTGSGRPYHATAKIYDPLYYNFKAHLCPQPEDVMYAADLDYSNEAAAYEQLRKTGQTGSTAPTYHGSWTFYLPITVDDKSYNRPVRLILIEELNGSTIRDTRVRNDPNTRAIDSFHYPEEYRLEVLARAMDAFVRQLQFGVDQSDFAGRNVVLVQDNSNASQAPGIPGGLALPRVVLIDYNHAFLKQGPYPSLPENPISIFWNVYLWEDFGGWAPREWEDGESHRNWLLRRFNADGQRQLYLPIQEKIVKEMERPGSLGPTSSGSSSRPTTPPQVRIGAGATLYWHFDTSLIGQPGSLQPKPLCSLAAPSKQPENPKSK